MSLTFAKKIFHPITAGGKLRTVLIVPFMIQIFLAVGLVSYLSARNGQRTVTNIANQLMEEVEDKISNRLDTYLKHPKLVNQLNQTAIELGALDPQNLDSFEKHFWKQSQLFEEISYIQFGNEKGEFVGLAINDDGSKNYQVTDSTGNLNTYEISETGTRAKLKSVTPDFDPRNRPWYTSPKTSNQATWTDIYAWVNPPTLAITLGVPQYKPNGEVAGIIATDLTIAQISDFLRTLEIGKSGDTFIMERDGMLVATSVEEDPFTIQAEKPERISASKSSDPRTQAAAEFLKSHYGDLAQITAEEQHTFEYKGEKQFLFVSPMTTKQGLDWLTVLVVPEDDFMATIHQNTFTTLLLSIGAALGAVFIGMITSKWVTRPILSMNNAAKAIAAGDLIQNIPETRIRELGELSSSFNEMAFQLQTSFEQMRTLNAALLKSEQQLASSNKSLEKQVQLQTNELVQSEKMAALGQLTAGIAHEINTPLGVIQASSENIETALTATMEDLPTLLQALPPEELAAFFIIVNASRSANTLLSSREERKLKKQFKALLKEEDISPVKPIADTLSKMGLKPDISEYQAILKAENNVDILNVAYQLSIVQNNSGNIRTAIKRVSKIVFALKSYARHDLSKQITQASVLDSIETVLTLYHNQIKKGVEVIKEFGDLPKIWCYPEELAQIWTNLVHNALQAMNYQGHLAILAYNDDDNIIVEVVDSGPGIPENIREKIFTPFFTTKPAGEGSGLGLDIVSQIVKKHQGEITVESRPGRTMFRIQLPILTEPPATEDAIAPDTPEDIEEDLTEVLQKSVSEAIAEVDPMILAIDAVE